MSISILASIDLSHPHLDHDAIEAALRHRVRGRLDALSVGRAQPDSKGPSTNILLQTEVFLGDMLPGPRATETAVVEDIHVALTKLYPDARISISTLGLDSADWIRVIDDDDHVTLRRPQPSPQL